MPKIIISILCFNLHVHELLCVTQRFTYIHCCENSSYNAHDKWQKSQSHQSRLDFREDRQEDNLLLHIFFHPGSSKSMYSLGLNTTPYGEVSVSTKPTLHTDKLKGKTKWRQQNAISKWQEAPQLPKPLTCINHYGPSPNYCPWGTWAYSRHV